MRWTRRLSACRPASVDWHDVSSNMRNSFRAQKDDRLCDLLRVAPPALRNRRQHRCLGTRMERLYSIGRGRTHQAGSHGVYSDSLSRVLQRRRFGKTRYAVLRSDVSDDTGRADQASHGALVHDGARPRFSISGISYFIQSQTPVRFVATTRFQSSSVVSTTPETDPTRPATSAPGGQSGRSISAGCRLNRKTVAMMICYESPHKAGQFSADHSRVDRFGKHDRVFHSLLVRCSKG